MAKVIDKSYTVESETLEGVYAQWRRKDSLLRWNCLFVSPFWLKPWWKSFGRGRRLCLFSIHDGDRTIGIAPLQRTDDTVRLIGNEDVCDNLDFIAAPDMSLEFYRILLDHLKRDGVRRLELAPVRQDSAIITELLPLAEKTGCRISHEEYDVSFELELPGSWESYLNILSGKERHEIRRKLRRLNAAGRISYRLVDDAFSVEREMETFLALFKSNRTDKASFMSDRMATFFRELAASLAQAHILRLFFLDLDEKPIAATMCFDYNSAMYLYNNGYDKRFSSLSPGLLSKVLSIKDSIQSGKKTYDFLKGAEVYKKRLGGQPVRIYRCLIELTE
jgi:CelD/BcsL family acetyltransferase involved in cellulose biosynthesis